jgi:hypothetical protein
MLGRRGESSSITDKEHSKRVANSRGTVAEKKFSMHSTAETEKNSGATAEEERKF